MIPQAPELTGLDLSAAREIRLRPGQPLMARMENGIWRGEHCLTPEEVTQAAQALSGHGLAAGQRELASGYLPLPGGHRMGICGRMGKEGMVEITSLCVRIAHEVKGVGEAIFPGLLGKNILILGGPGTGKTTLLRDLIRLYGEVGWQVGVADERGELAACQGGKPQLDVGPCADVITGMEKARALLLLIRAMAPQVVACDELGGLADARAVLEAMQCGVNILCTAHGNSENDWKRRPGMNALAASGVFEKMVILRGAGLPPEIRGEGICK